MSLAFGALLFLYVFGQQIDGWAFAVTGEENWGAQVRGMWQLMGNSLRPRVRLAEAERIRHAGVNPFGVNTFLEQEVELSKRERQVKMIAEAGFRWIRQEFPWYDIEIHAKGDFQDRRSETYREAWEKYDNIVELAGERNLQIIARLSSPPKWALDETHWEIGFGPPEVYADFVDYVSAVAKRYRGQISYYQIWNEPNIYPEWGEEKISPERYTELLCLAASAIRVADPDAVILSAALAPTAALTDRDLNDFIFLQRMYMAGAGECFDVMSVQGYGLWSGPTDRRMRPGSINYGRNQYIRDIMVANGDSSKAIWISEMNWNAVPVETGLPANYGRVSLEQQSDWAALAYERARVEWPWIGVVSLWYFKRADASEADQTWYYFRVLDPDFGKMPIYDGLKSYIRDNPY